MTDLNKNQPQKTIVSRDPNTHLMSKKELKALHDIVKTYMIENDVTFENAVIALVDSDSRFSGGFSCAEIAVIMGSTLSNIRMVEKRALSKLNSPAFRMEKEKLQIYVEIDDSECESDF